MFHAVGLNAIEKREMYKDVADVFTNEDNILYHRPRQVATSSTRPNVFLRISEWFPRVLVTVLLFTWCLHKCWDPSRTLARWNHILSIILISTFLVCYEHLIGLVSVEPALKRLRSC